MKKIIVIGGGASGIVAAIKAKNENNQVILLERNSNCLKKILVTGNGRCNYYNENQDLIHYHSNNNELIQELINYPNLEKMKIFFKNIGIIPRIKNGNYYPYSNQAVSIQNALIITAREQKIKIVTDTFVEDILNLENSFLIKTNNGEYYADKIIVSTGGMAAPKTGSDGNFYKILKKLGHQIIEPLPALVQVNINGNFLKQWSGIRADVYVKLLEDNKEIKDESGEILLTNYGLSGICIMQLSGIIARGLFNNKKEEIIINFLPSIASNRQEFIKFMDERSKLLPKRNITELLDTILNYKLINILVAQAKINTTKKWEQLTDKEKNTLAKNFTQFIVNVTSTNSFNNAQTTSGGVLLTEINLDKMESKIIKNLYLTGEVIDIYGDCGGYNLTFSFISGIIAGESVND